jgi:hypothetical protein
VERVLNVDDVTLAFLSEAKIGVVIRLAAASPPRSAARVTPRPRGLGVTLDQQVRTGSAVMYGTKKMRR